MIPFFIEKIINWFPVISFTTTDHRRSHETYVPPPRYRPATPYTPMDIPPVTRHNIAEGLRNQAASQMPRVPLPRPRPNTPKSYMDPCTMRLSCGCTSLEARYGRIEYEVDEYSGSGYVLCKHGNRIY